MQKMYRKVLFKTTINKTKLRRSQNIKKQQLRAYRADRIRCSAHKTLNACCEAQHSQK